MIALAILAGIALFALIVGPQIAINWVMASHGAERPDFPGTGGELARHLLDQAGLREVTVEKTDAGDHYAPLERAVRLSPSHFDGRSVTAAAVAAHEVSHALQHRDSYAPLMLRQRMIGWSLWVQRSGSALLMATPIVFLVIRSPAVLVAQLLIAIAIFGASILIHAVTLPTELDASYKRALPILSGYLKPEDLPGARRVLTAAAFTYVAGALISLINFARWMRVLRF